MAASGCWRPGPPWPPASATGPAASCGTAWSSPDLREGEDALDELWFAYHGEERDLPADYDFRMS
ncbi:hypothetical protein [Nonomuraea dietziae]|uniref:hypothetical protein n=1 Tax=Nonomuraea dietziae TaxID=65515 RepID=UPI0031D394E1